MSAISIRNAAGTDAEAITSLFRGVFHKEMSADQWNWKYRLASQLKLISAVATTAAGEVIGHVGAIPTIGADSGYAIAVWQLADAMVHPDYRGADLFGGLLRQVGHSIREAGEAAVCYAFAGPDSTRIGLQKKILHSRSKMLCHVLDGPLRSSRRFGWSLEQVPFTDSRLVKIWERSCGGRAVFARRTREYFEWRYSTNPFQSYSAALLKHLFRPAGWLIWSSDGDGIRLVDCCLEPADLDVALTLLAGSSGENRKVSFWLPASAVRGSRLPLKSEDTPICLMFLNPESIQDPPSCMDKDYFVTMSDADIY